MISEDILRTLPPSVQEAIKTAPPAPQETQTIKEITSTGRIRRGGSRVSVSTQQQPKQPERPRTIEVPKENLQKELTKIQQDIRAEREADLIRALRRTREEQVRMTAEGIEIDEEEDRKTIITPQRDILKVPRTAKVRGQKVARNIPGKTIILSDFPEDKIKVTEKPAQLIVPNAEAVRRQLETKAIKQTIPKTTEIQFRRQLQPAGGTISECKPFTGNYIIKESELIRQIAGETPFQRLAGIVEDPQTLTKFGLAQQKEGKKLIGGINVFAGSAVSIPAGIIKTVKDEPIEAPLILAIGTVKFFTSPQEFTIAKTPGAATLEYAGIFAGGRVVGRGTSYLFKSAKTAYAEYRLNKLERATRGADIPGDIILETQKGLFRKQYRQTKLLDTSTTQTTFTFRTESGVIKRSVQIDKIEPSIFLDIRKKPVTNIFSDIEGNFKVMQGTRSQIVSIDPLRSPLKKTKAVTPEAEIKVSDLQPSRQIKLTTDTGKPLFGKAIIKDPFREFTVESIAFKRGAKLTTIKSAKTPILAAEPITGSIFSFAETTKALINIYKANIFEKQAIKPRLKLDIPLLIPPKEEQRLKDFPLIFEPQPVDIKREERFTSKRRPDIPLILEPLIAQEPIIEQPVLIGQTPKPQEAFRPEDIPLISLPSTKPKKPTPENRLPPEKPPPQYALFGETPSKKGRRLTGFNAYAISQGKPIKLNKNPITKNRAKNLIMSNLDITPSIRGNIKKTTAPARSSREVPLSILRGKFKFMGNKMIEKKKYRYDSPGELTGLRLGRLVNKKYARLL